jgi:hypothetical protein
MIKTMLGVSDRVVVGDSKLNANQPIQAIRVFAVFCILVNLHRLVGIWKVKAGIAGLPISSLAARCRFEPHQLHDQRLLGAGAVEHFDSPRINVPGVPAIASSRTVCSAYNQTAPQEDWLNEDMSLYFCMGA